VLEEVEGEAPLNPLAQTLIQKFVVVFPSDQPSSLPPLRAIEYQIDVLPESTLPNMPIYRCNLTKTKEL